MKPRSVTSFLSFSIAILFCCAFNYEAFAQKGKPPKGSSSPLPAITDLTLGTMVDNSIPLTWTAPGDETTSTASDYHTRYIQLEAAGLIPDGSTTDLHGYCTQIMKDHWDSAREDRVDGPSPQPPGTVQTYRIKNLDEHAPYCVAIAARYGRDMSAPSNGVYAETLSPLPSEYDPVLVDGGPAVWSTSLAFNPDGTPAIAYADGGADELRFAQWTGASWDIAVLDAGNTSNISPSLAIDPDGHPAIAFTRSTKSWSAELIFMSWDANTQSWVRETIDTRGAIAPVLVYQGGEPAICYDSSRDGLKYARRTGSSWSTEVIDANGRNVCSLAFDASGSPIVAYRADRDGDGSTDDLVLAWRTGAGAWERATVAHDIVGRGHGIVHDGTSPLVAFALTSGMYAERYVQLATLDGATGEVIHTSNIATTGYTTSLGLVSGQPIVVYEDYAYLYAVSWSGADRGWLLDNDGWETAIIHTGLSWGGSIAEDPNRSVPAVSFNYRTPAGEYQLKFGHFTCSYASGAAENCEASAGKSGIALEDDASVPTAFSLSENYPNPFNPATNFSVTVDRDQHVKVEVFDLLGRPLMLLHDGLLEAGKAHRFTFDAGPLPSGLYVYRASAASGSKAGFMTLAK